MAIALFSTIYTPLYSAQEITPSQASAAHHQLLQQNDYYDDFANLVFGYIREEEKKLGLSVPLDVKKICLLFYRRKEYFDENLAGDLINTDSDNQTITIHKDGPTINTAYGFVHIKPLPPNANRKYIWKFKVISCCGYIYIGLDDSAATWKNSWFAGRTGTNNYAYCCNGWKYSHQTGGTGRTYAERFQEGSVVLMKLYLSSKSATLSFGLMKYGNDWQNDNSFFVTPAFEHIPQKKHNLRMAVCLRHGSAVQLLAYKEEIETSKSNSKK